jgi:hypothetical protein
MLRTVAPCVETLRQVVGLQSIRIDKAPTEEGIGVGDGRAGWRVGTFSPFSLLSQCAKRAPEHGDALDFALGVLRTHRVAGSAHVSRCERSERSEKRSGRTARRRESPPMDRQAGTSSAECPAGLPTVKQPDPAKLAYGQASRRMPRRMPMEWTGLRETGGSADNRPGGASLGSQLANRVGPGPPHRREGARPRAMPRPVRGPRSRSRS